MSNGGSARASALRVLGVALAVAAACSVLVAGTALALRDLQRANAKHEQHRKILAAAGVEVGDSRSEIETAFEKFHAVLVDLRTGLLLNPESYSPDDWELRDYLGSDEKSRELTPEEDLATIRRLETVAPIYFTCKSGRLDILVLPVRGYGLWGTLHGYLALDGSLRRTRGLEFHTHKETPGLGGEVDNPKWKQQWREKLVYGPEGVYALRVTKGATPPDSLDARFSVDGLSGATLTTQGVDRLLNFWLGDHGFWPLLYNLSGAGALSVNDPRPRRCPVRDSTAATKALGGRA